MNPLKAHSRQLNLSSISGPAFRLIRQSWKRFVSEPIRQAEIESEEDQRKDRGRFDWKALVVCVVVAVNLTLLNYYGMSDRSGWLIGTLSKLGLEGASASLSEALSFGPRARIYSLFYWVSSCIALYFLVPALVVRFVFRQKLTDYGMGIRGALKHYKVYVVLFLAILPLIISVSSNEAFQRQYPFYKAFGDSELPAGLVYWELAYGLQFFALEFFFRGFMVHGLKRRMGAYAVLVMAVPYCMIHFGKPFPETLGAIIAGLVLGMLSLRTRSIWLGVWIHVSVAWTMDFLSLWQKGLLF